MVGATIHSYWLDDQTEVVIRKATSVSPEQETLIEWLDDIRTLLAANRIGAVYAMDLMQRMCLLRSSEEREEMTW